jgi:hypothetical protein
LGKLLAKFFSDRHHAYQEKKMKPTLREIAILAVAILLAAIALLVPARSVAGAPQQGGVSITLGVGQQPGAVFTLNCISRSSRRTYCAADTRGGATLQAQLPGSAPCVFGSTWGADGAGIWVQQGCRASFVVNPYTSGPWWWDPGQGHRPPSRGIPSRGACFFKEKYYRGEYFCMSRGSSFNVMPVGFNNEISSIKVYGRVSVTFYKNADFQSDNATLNGSVPDLAAWRLPSDRSRNWNNKISSVQVN